MCSKPYLNVFTCFCINWPTLIVMQTALNKCNRPTFIPLLWKNIRCCPRVISRSRLLHVCMWYKTKLFSTGFFRWRGWTKIQHICVTAATNCSSTLKTNNGLFSVMIIPFLAKALLYRMCLCVLTLKEAKKKKKRWGRGGRLSPFLSFGRHKSASDLRFSGFIPIQWLQNSKKCNTQLSKKETHEIAKDGYIILWMRITTRLPTEETRHLVAGVQEAPGSVGLSESTISGESTSWPAGMVLETRTWRPRSRLSFWSLLPGTESWRCCGDPKWCSTCCLGCSLRLGPAASRSRALRSGTWARSFLRGWEGYARYWNTGRGHPHLLSDKAHKRSIKIPIIRTPAAQTCPASETDTTPCLPLTDGLPGPPGSWAHPAGLWESRNGRHSHFRLLFYLRGNTGAEKNQWACPF